MRISFTVFLAATCAITSEAFTVPQSSTRNYGASRWMSMSSEDGAQKSLVVISPPGGVGESTAVKAASMGSSVRWFVVSDSSNSKKVTLSQETLASIAAAGGKVELAGADTESLLLPVEDAQSAMGAVSQWCGAADSLVCTFDGVENAVRQENAEDPVKRYMDSIKVAAKEAGRSVRGRKLAILPADTDDAAEETKDGGLLGSLLGGKKVEIPASLDGAMAADASKVVKLRHGELFGVPESSPDFSPLIGGPRRDPVLCEEYSMRSVRVDPTLSVSGNTLKSSNSRTSRLSVGEAAARIALGSVSAADGLDVFLSSQSGRNEVPDETWEEEFGRVEKMLSSGAGAQLFEASFSSVPDVERLADWIATKWAPAVLRTYELAGIRIGARPVYAVRAGDGRTEIVWQQLDNFETATVGKMIIQVSENGIVATRAPGDASKGFGSISRKPLNGEDVLVRTLADAASQAVEKGLAKKAVVEKQRSKKKAPVAPVSSVVASGDVVAEAPSAPSLESGPRQAGARRSSQRDRGTRRRKLTPPPEQGDDSKSFQ